MIFIDTSYLVALAIRADALHKTAIEWSRRAAGPFLTTQYILLEFVNGLSAENRRSSDHRLLGAICSNPSIEIIPASDPLFQEGLKLHASRSDKCWSLTDCISFNVMRDAGISDALTYDRHFEQAGFRALLQVSPT